MNFLFNFSPGASGSGRPSFFEMYLPSQMMSSLKPAMKYLLSIACQRFPRLSVAYKHSDELFACVMFVLEHHFLRHYDGSFAENFYGLKRSRVAQQGGKKLPFLKRERYLSLIFLVLVPYLKDKLDQWYNRNYAHNVALLRAGDVEDFRNSASNSNANNASQGAGSVLSSLFSKIISREKKHALMRVLYPSFHAAYEGSHFLYQLLYLYDYTSYFTPFLHLMDLRVTRLSATDLLLQSQRTYLRRSVRNTTNPIAKIFWAFVEVLGVLVDLSKFLLPLTVFFFNFLEWWYRDANKGRIADQEPIPPPPEPPRVSIVTSTPESQIKLENRAYCPICDKPRVNPAMLPSGFVFCYTCIHPYIQEHGKCPVTQMPFSVERIRRVFDESSD